MKKLIVILSTLLLSSASAFGGYAYHRTITVPTPPVGGITTDLTNFPLLIEGTYSYLATIANGGKVQSASGYDIVFTSDAGCSSLLSWEQESWSATTGAVIYWVKIPTLYHVTTPNVIYLCYGNAATASFQGGALGAAWDAYYKGVYHLPNGSSLTTLDSTANALDCYPVGGPTAIAAKINGAAIFGGGTPHIECPTATLNDGFLNYNLSLTSPLTLSSWVKADSLTNNTDTIFQTGQSNSPFGGIWWRQSYDNLAGKPTFAIFDSTGVNIRSWSTSAATTINNWFYLVATYDGSKTAGGILIYVNGILQTLSTSTTGTPADLGNNFHFQIGHDNGSGGQAYYGTIDETRISEGIARSADWNLAEYTNQVTAGAMYTVSDEAAAGVRHKGQVY